MQFFEHILTVCLVVTFIGAGTALFSRAAGILILRVAVFSLAAFYLWATYNYLWHNIRMADAFGGDRSQTRVWYLYFPLLMCYYGLAALTTLTRPLKPVAILALHFVLGPVVAIFQFSGLFGTAMLNQRFLHLLCFVLLWLRLQQLRTAPIGTAKSIA